MPSENYTLWLSDKVYVVVEFVTVLGRVVSLVVRLMCKTTKEVRCVVRYDTAHGMPHKDIVSRDGTLLRKEWLGDISLNDALTLAIDDLKENYEDYLREQHYGKNASRAGGSA